MSTKIAMELLLQGKKIREREWCKRRYIKLDEYGNIVDEDGKNFSIKIDADNRWEEYIVEFHEVLKHILNGGEAQRVKRSGELVTVFIDEIGQLRCRIITDDIHKLNFLDKEDLNATNWSLIKTNE